MIMFWVALLAISILLYLLLDGFDLGVGILYGLAKSEADRTTMLSTIAPVWDGNETWLVVSGVILRGVAFEYRGRTRRLRWVWDFSFASGSLVATFMQGAIVGALVEGFQFVNGQYSRGMFG